MLDIFKDLEDALKTYQEKKDLAAAEENKIFNKVIKKQEEYISYLKPIEDFIDYSEYTKLVSNKFKTNMHEFYELAKSNKCKLKKYENRILTLKNKIVFLSNLTITDFINVLSFFNFPCEIKKSKSELILNYNNLSNSNVETKAINFTNLPIFPIYILSNNEIILNPLISDIISPEMEAFIRFYINIKYNDIYMLMDEAFYTFQENSCIIR